MTAEQIDDLLKRISSIPGMLGGKPVIRGMRFPVTEILEMLASGMTPDEILNEHPLLEKEDIQAALIFASLKINNTSVSNAA